MYKILIVEDDRTISSIIKENLDKWEYISFTYGACAVAYGVFYLITKGQYSRIVGN